MKFDFFSTQVGEEESKNHQVAMFSSFVDYISRDQCKKFVVIDLFVALAAWSAVSELAMNS